MNVCAVVPVFNESAHIERVVSACRDHCPVVVIDDGSTDDSARIAANAGAEVIRLPENSGKGAALQRGFAHALGRHFDTVIQLDGDGQHDPHDIPRMIAAAEAGPSVGMVIGSRMADTGPMPALRVLTNRVMSAVVSWLCGQRVLDTQSGFRLIRSSVLGSVTLTAGRYDIETELLIRTCQAGFAVTEVPIKTIYGDEVSDIHVGRETWAFLKLVCRHMGRRPSPPRPC